MYNETHEIVKQHETLTKLGYRNVTQTEETIRIHIEAVDMSDLEELEMNGFKVLFIAADFPTGMFVSVKKEGTQ